MRHLSQGLVCTVTTVNSHLPCAALSPFIPRMELCQGLPSGLRAIHVVSRAQALWAPPSLGRKGGLRARCRPSLRLGCSPSESKSGQSLRDRGQHPACGQAQILLDSSLRRSPSPWPARGHQAFHREALEPQLQGVGQGRHGPQPSSGSPPCPGFSLQQRVQPWPWGWTWRTSRCSCEQLKVQTGELPPQQLTVCIRNRMCSEDPFFSFTRVTQGT